MRTVTFFNNQDISSPVTSTPYEVECGKDMRWMLQIITNAEGFPKLYIEESADNIDWVALQNPETWEHYFLIDDAEYNIRDSYFMGKSMRLRIEPNGAGGYMTAKLVVKSKSN